MAVAMLLDTPVPVLCLKASRAQYIATVHPALPQYDYRHRTFLAIEDPQMSISNKSHRSFDSSTTEAFNDLPTAK